MFLQNLHVFMRALRAAGLPISQGQMTDAAQAIGLVNIADRNQFFHATRSLLVSRVEHLVIFETLFNAFFASSMMHGSVQQTMPRAPRHKTPERPFDVTSYMAYKARQTDEEIEVGDKSRTISNAELLNTKDFGEMSPEELQTLREVMQRMEWPWVKRETRRRVSQRNGALLHLRGVMRNAARTAGIPIKLAWQTRKVKQRPIVLIADISGSMERYSRVLLMFFHCISMRMKGVHSFVFGTRLTNITHALTLRNLDIAISEARRDVVDWSSGTRIGESLAQFNRRWARRVLRRGALVILISDGWERGDVTELAREMRYLHHRSHRLVWLNPLSGDTAYAPEVEGMRAALPHVDDFLPMHNLHSLKEVNKRLAALTA